MKRFLFTLVAFGAFASPLGCGSGSQDDSSSGPRSSTVGSHPTPTPTPSGGTVFRGSAALAPVAGGTMTNRLHSSIVGVGKQQSILSSPSFRVIGNVQGALYGNP